MFAFIKKLIMRKKRKDIEEAINGVFAWHFHSKFGDNPWTSSGDISRKHWNDIFRKLRDEGTIYDIKSSNWRYVHGVLVSKHIEYKIRDKERFDEVLEAAGWRK